MARCRQRDTSRQGRNRCSFRATGGADALILQPQLPPFFVVVAGRRPARKTPPAPLVHQQPKGRNATLSRARFIGSRYPSSDPAPRQSNQSLQIVGRDGKRNRVADGFMKAVVRAVAEQGADSCRRAGNSCAPVRDGWSRSLRGDLDAHLKPQSFSMSMSQALAWHTTSRSRGLTKSERSQNVVRKRRKAQRCEEALAVADHLLSSIFLAFRIGSDRSPVRFCWRRHQRIDVPPGLRPHIAEQMGGNRCRRPGPQLRAIFLAADCVRT